MDEQARALVSAASVRSERSLLRFLTCGSVDDGKSTLIGRLLIDSGDLKVDQLEALAVSSLRHGTNGENLDPALLVDGLISEREQGITIDVAYRYFGSGKRRFIIADTPGHERYTRNMVTAASGCDAAVILVDARAGLQPQTRRHAAIVSLMGIRHIMLAVNKIDLVDYSPVVFRDIVARSQAMAADLAFVSVATVPVSALHGDNVVCRSGNTPWFEGLTLLEWLDDLDIASQAEPGPLRLPVQYVNRPDPEFRGYCGTIAGGILRAGQKVVVSRTGETAGVSRIVTFDGDLENSLKGDAVTVVLDRPLDVQRGDLLVDMMDRPSLASQFTANVIWMAEEHLIPGRQYLLKLGTKTVRASFPSVRSRLDTATMARHDARSLALNEIGLTHVATSEPISFDSYSGNVTTGSFVIIDRATGRTLGAGLVERALNVSTNVALNPLGLKAEQRATQKNQKPVVLWFTGLSGAGKSTIANLVDRHLYLRGLHTYMLDGDNLRHGLNQDLGFSEADRVENVRRVTEVAKLFADAGLIVLVALISPYRSERDAARERFNTGEFIEVFVNTPLSICRVRDAKGLYAKADRGEIRNFSGLDSPYEVPVSPDIELTPGEYDAAACAEMVIEYLRRLGHFEPTVEKLQA